MTELAATRTHATAQQIVDSLLKLWPSELGSVGPSLEMACVLAAQWAFETAEGVDMVQWNIGNSKYTGAGDFCFYPTEEYVNGKPVMIRPPDPGCRFQCFPTIDEGVRAWLRSFYTHWTLAWPSACAGDPAGFAQGLHDQQPPYYTGPVQDYIAGLKRYFDKYIGTLHVPQPDDTDPGVVTAPGVPTSGTAE